ncbi:MAG: CDP-alcohol phosphatidyltransferase family protein [Thermoproteota archaeon]|nr:CDP-alcohol phosphatidyltransferase family protein [Thermoproteota archaeon]
MFEKVGVGFASLGFGPSFWTWIGLLLSIISAIMFSLHSPAIGVPWYTATVLGGIFLIVAGFFDAVDGAVARATKKTSALGGFLDSVIDKVSEIIVFVGILIGSYTNPVLVLVALSLSLLVSYTRARGESIGVDLKGKGIAERAERILILSILAFIPFQDNISVALWIISILAVITVIERLRVVSAIFGVSIFSIQAMKDIFKRDVTARSNGFSSPSSESNTTKFSNDQSSTSKVTSSIKDLLKKPAIRKETRPEETRTTTPRKAMFIDNGSDPNETGRNTDQIISELEEEDRKIAKSVPPSPSPDLKKDNEKPSTTTSSTTTTTTKTSPSETSPSETNVKKEDNDKANELQ